jgi:acyl-CoA synthetase (AMP-forming)/AMP-acid ligase II
MAITSPYADIDVPDVSIHDFIFGTLNDDEADLVALLDGPTGASTTFRALRDQVEGYAGALVARGVSVGDVVAIHAPNVPAFVAVFHGILRAGATATPVNSLYTSSDIAKQLTDSGAKLLITVSALLPAAEAGATAAGLSPEQIVVLDGAEGYASARDLLASGAVAPEVTFDPATHLAVLPYSSGTTGTPKGVMLTHRNLVANVLQSAPLVGVTRRDNVLAVLPFFHIYGMTVLLNLSLHVRATVVTVPRFDLPEFLRVIQDHRCTYVFIAPPIAVALAKHPLVDQYDLSSVEVVLSGAASLDETLGRAVQDRLGVQVLQGYGMTEMSPISHVIPRDRRDISIGSIGLTIPNVEIRIVDTATGNEVEVPVDGRSEPGELLVRGPNVMTGYLGNAEATRETIDADGFLHTGDIARIDADGAVWIVDRVKELIKYKGYQVPPAELEAVLLTHPGIADAAVIGHPDDDAGEVPKAFIVVQAGADVTGADVTGDEVIAFVAERVAPHKKVRIVEFVEVIPKSPSGKILRKDLRARSR